MKFLLLGINLVVSFAIDESYPDSKDDNGKETLRAFTL